jgi:hypothetical protein
MVVSMQRRKLLKPHDGVIVNIWFPQSDDQKNGPLTAAGSFSYFNPINPIFLWHSASALFGKPANANSDKDKKPTDKNIFHAGHISFQTRHTYARWFPEAGNEDFVREFTVDRTQIEHAFASDCGWEGGAPDVQIYLYSLDAAAIENAYRNIELNNPAYQRDGEKQQIKLFHAKKAHNCSSLALELLEIGGIRKLEYFYQDLTAKWLAITPANLGELIKHAKAYEISAYPETSDFPYGSTQPLQRGFSMV